MTVTTNKMRHLAENSWYELANDRVTITRIDSGETGTFTFEGRWLSGEITAADRQMLRILAIPGRGTRVAASVDAPLEGAQHMMKT